MLTIAGGAGAIHVVDLREESPEPSGAMPIVFVHGMVGHTGFWNAVLAACADHRRAVAIDLRGHGNSSAPSDGDYSVEACAGDVLAVTDTLGISEFVLVGHSYGTLVAIEAAARRPTAVRRLILVDPPGDFNHLAPEVRERELTPFLAAIAGDGWRPIVEAAFDRALEGGTTATSAAIRARLASMPHGAMLGMYRSMFGYDATGAIERYLETPGATIYAILAPPNDWSFSLHKRVPAIRTTVIPNVGHWIMLDAPDQFLAALEEAAAGT